jgi:hypothetical protein
VTGVKHREFCCFNCLTRNHLDLILSGIYRDGWPIYDAE